MYSNHPTRSTLDVTDVLWVFHGIRNFQEHGIFRRYESFQLGSQEFSDAFQEGPTGLQGVSTAFQRVSGGNYKLNGKFSIWPLGVLGVVRCIMLVILQSVQSLVDDGVVSFSIYPTNSTYTYLKDMKVSIYTTH